MENGNTYNSEVRTTVEFLLQILHESSTFLSDSVRGHSKCDYGFRYSKVRNKWGGVFINFSFLRHPLLLIVIVFSLFCSRFFLLGDHEIFQDNLGGCQTF